MKLTWLKRSMPRGLYGRAALILLVPIVLLQVAISIVFIQRHFEDVTAQLTRGVVLELQLVRQIYETEGLSAAEALAQELDIGWHAQEIPPPDRDLRVFYDVSGLTVIFTLRDRLGGVQGVDLASSSRAVDLWLDTGRGPVQARVSRRRVSASNPHQFLVLMAAIGLLMYGVAFVYLRNQLRPITQLASVAEAFGKGVAEPYRPAGATEVRAAGQAFVDMRDRIDRQIKQRTMLLSGVSHDLRTPLTRMKLELSLLDGVPEAKTLERDVDEMQTLVDGFLDFARGGSTETPAPVAPAEIARAVIDRVARAGGDVVLADIPEAAELAVPLRRVSVERALGNLVGNAVRYATRAEVAVSVDAGEVVFVVEDDGPGIAPDRRTEATEPFSRLDAARNQDRGSGVGLGLAIACDVARGHGGRLVLGDSHRLGGLAASLILAL